MLPNDALFVEFALAGVCFIAGVWISGRYYAHRTYQLRLTILRNRVAEWAVAA
jgi:hypothetical protein